MRLAHTVVQWANKTITITIHNLIVTLSLSEGRGNDVGGLLIMLINVLEVFTVITSIRVYIRKLHYN